MHAKHDSDSADLGWSLGVCISKELPSHSAKLNLTRAFCDSLRRWYPCMVSLFYSQYPAHNKYSIKICDEGILTPSLASYVCQLRLPYQNID
jgi:hypothetical protein